MLLKKTRKNISIRRNSPRPKKNSRFLEMAIIAIFTLVVIYGASFAIRITQGLSKTVDSPEYTIRLQILNGCGTQGAAGRTAKALPKLVKMPLELNIVDIDDFNSYHVDKSFIISRERDFTAARLLAQQLNIDSDNIVYEPIDSNYRSISATLVLGDDFVNLIEQTSSKEN
nr:LytR C-terminal domain-containing protein [candidate division Zixibacteria bacterium]